MEKKIDFNPCLYPKSSIDTIVLGDNKEAMDPDSCGLIQTAGGAGQMNIIDLHSKVIEINSADEVRQAIKAAFKTRTTQHVAIDNMSADLHFMQAKEVQVSGNQENIPGTGFLVKKPIKVTLDQEPARGRQEGLRERKRRGRSPKAGPSKRKKRTRNDPMDEFYTGKLSNVVKLSANYNRDIKCKDLFPKSNFACTCRKLRLK